MSESRKRYYRIVMDNGDHFFMSAKDEKGAWPLLLGRKLGEFATVEARLLLGVEARSGRLLLGGEADQAINLAKVVDCRSCWLIFAGMDMKHPTDGQTYDLFTIKQ